MHTHSGQVSPRGRRLKNLRSVLILVSVLLAGVIVAPRAAMGADVGGTTAQGVNANNEGYIMLSLTALTDVASVTVGMAPGTDYVVAFVADEGVNTTPLPYEDTPPWRLIGSHTFKNSITFNIAPARRTRYVLVLARRFNGSGAPAPMTLTADGVAVESPPPAPPPAPPSSGGTPASQCSDLGDGAVDQNGVSVDVWAPGLRSACGQLGYENGDDPMPAGTPLPPPRPFRFDYVVDHNEAVHGFKVFYWNGDSRRCGDMRLIMHQGGSTHGMMTRFHTFQFAYAWCDATGNKKIVDVGGQVDTGALVLHSQPSNPIGTTSGGMRLTADTDSCTGRPGTSTNCFVTWYLDFKFQVPNVPAAYGATVTSGISVEFSVNDPITLADPADLMHLVLTNSRGATGWDGVSRTLGNWFIYNFASANQATWWTTFDPNTGVQRAVPAGTPGAWQMRVDSGISAPGSGLLAGNCVFGFSCQRRTHDNNVAGIVYPN